MTSGDGDRRGSTRIWSVLESSNRLSPAESRVWNSSEVVVVERGCVAGAASSMKLSSPWMLVRCSVKRFSTRT